MAAAAVWSEMPSGILTSRCAGIQPHLGIGAGRAARVGHAIAGLNQVTSFADRLDHAGALRPRPLGSGSGYRPLR